MVDIGLVPQENADTQPDDTFDDHDWLLRADTLPMSQPGLDPYGHVFMPASTITTQISEGDLMTQPEGQSEHYLASTPPTMLPACAETDTEQPAADVTGHSSDPQLSPPELQPAMPLACELASPMAEPLAGQLAGQPLATESWGKSIYLLAPHTVPKCA